MVFLRPDPGVSAMVAEDRRRIESFLASGPWAVVGASTSRTKYGNRVLRAYLQTGREVYAVNPKERLVEGVACYPSLRDLPVPVRGVSVITPPAVTEAIVEDLPASGAELVWMQSGAESRRAIDRAAALGLEVIAGGPCILVALRYRET
jgi:predicted CoA-binding protein